MTRKENPVLSSKDVANILPCTSCRSARAVTAPAVVPRATSPCLFPGTLDAPPSKGPKAEEPQAQKNTVMCVLLEEVKPSWPQQRNNTFKRQQMFQGYYLHWAF